VKAPRNRNNHEPFKIQLRWKRPTGGFEIADGVSHLVVGLKRHEYWVLRPIGDSTQDVTHELSNLEDPIVVRFINARDRDGILSFVNRFGMLRDEPNAALDELFFTSDRLWASLIRSTAVLQMSDTLVHANTLLRGVALHPLLQSAPDGATHLVLEPNSLLGLMAMEIALAHQAGAAVTSCEQCEKVFLTGPLTGRRSHARYCSDRCRVAAMRKRNAAGRRIRDVRS
jgi:hypothetical protein